jgi:hypothetical protein
MELGQNRTDGEYCAASLYRNKVTWNSVNNSYTYKTKVTVAVMSPDKGDNSDFESHNT